MIKLMKKNLQHLIEERLSLQSTRRALEEYRLPKLEFNYFKSIDFIQLFNSWDDNKKTKFLRTAAGNYQKKFLDYIKQEDK